MAASARDIARQVAEEDRRRARLRTAAIRDVARAAEAAEEARRGSDERVAGLRKRHRERVTVLREQLGADIEAERAKKQTARVGLAQAVVAALEVFDEVELARYSGMSDQMVASLVRLARSASVGDGSDEQEEDIDGGTRVGEDVTGVDGEPDVLSGSGEDVPNGMVPPDGGGVGDAPAAGGGHRLGAGGVGVGGGEYPPQAGSMSP
ncbi:hypothetical protein ACFFSW_17625 [Saccharothrix longispora]|uniref:Uncharacterized protein n=1 Tax=Saccharothrix longispora TaxID=33920 RepID=A0ABU1PSN9_9PSEU|nr:hypothetical protein [Saccharothrix longispora]MDR6593606.1 hypothetical protein [Saccharothrix longispora]